jgi:hypothetical protein
MADEASPRERLNHLLAQAHKAGLAHSLVARGEFVRTWVQILQLARTCDLSEREPLSPAPSRMQVTAATLNEARDRLMSLKFRQDILARKPRLDRSAADDAELDRLREEIELIAHEIRSVERVEAA